MSRTPAPSPVPEDIANTLADTKPAQEDRTNRRDVPVSSFDFLQGSYASSRRAHAVLAALAAVALLALAAVAFLTFGAHSSLATARADLDAVETRTTASLADFGTADGVGGEVGELIEREEDLVGALTDVALTQPDISTILATIDGLGNSVEVLEIVIGASGYEERFGITTQERSAVLIVAEGLTLVDAAAWGDELRGLSMFDSTVVIREGVTGVAVLALEAAPMSAETAVHLGRLSIDPSDRASSLRSTPGAEPLSGVDPDGSEGGLESGLEGDLEGGLEGDLEGDLEGVLDEPAPSPEESDNQPAEDEQP